MSKMNYDFKIGQSSITVWQISGAEIMSYLKL